MQPPASKGEGWVVRKCASKEEVHFLRLLASSRESQVRPVYQLRVSSQEWEEEECVSKVGDRWDSPRASIRGNLESQLLSSKEGATRLGPASREQGWGCWVLEWLASTLVNLVPPFSEKVDVSPENTLTLIEQKWMAWDTHQSFVPRHR
jgi:hypothetical protein